MDRARVSAWLRRLHRWLGLTAAAFVLLLAVTGLLLNHADTLSLDHHRLRADWIVRLYGLEPPALVDAREAGAHWISLWGSRLFLDDAPIDRVGASTLVAAFGGNDHDDDAFLTVVTDRQLLLLTPSGELIDVLAAPTSRPLVAATRRLDGPPGPRTEIRSDDGQRWSTDADALEAVVEDERGFEAAVGQEKGIAKLWQRIPVLRTHGSQSSDVVDDREGAEIPLAAIAALRYSPAIRKLSLPYSPLRGAPPEGRPRRIMSFIARRCGAPAARPPPPGRNAPG